MTEHTAEFLACYRDTYGRYGNTNADHSRCCIAVSVPGAWSRSKQCTRKNGHGTHGAYCKQHDPVAVKAKDEARSAAWRAEWDAKSRAHNFAGDCIAAIRAIASGHNDPRALAQSIIDKLEAAQ